MYSYIIIGKLHDDVWFCSIFKHEKLMNFTPSMVAFHDTSHYDLSEVEEHDFAELSHSMYYLLEPKAEFQLIFQ